MQDKASRKQDFPKMADITVEAMEMTQAAARPVAPGESIKAQIRKASIRLQIPFSRTRKYWYGEITRPRADEIDRMRAVTKKVGVNDIRETIASRRASAGSEGLSLDRGLALALAELLTDIAEGLPE